MSDKQRMRFSIGHIYTEKLCVVYQKHKFNQASYILSENSTLSTSANTSFFFHSSV